MNKGKILIATIFLLGTFLTFGRSYGQLFETGRTRYLKSYAAEVFDFDCNGDGSSEKIPTLPNAHNMAHGWLSGVGVPTGWLYAFGATSGYWIPNIDPSDDPYVSNYADFGWAVATGATTKDAWIKSHGRKRGRHPTSKADQCPMVISTEAAKGYDGADGRVATKVEIHAAPIARADATEPPRRIRYVSAEELGRLRAVSSPVLWQAIRFALCTTPLTRMGARHKRDFRLSGAWLRF